MSSTAVTLRQRWARRETVGDNSMSHDRRKKSTKKPARVLAPIRSDELYSLQMLRGLTGWGDSAIRAARAGGLKPIYLHRRVFYRGCDVVEYIAKAAEAQDDDDPRS
jgi:hypothetical protein